MNTLKIGFIAGNVIIVIGLIVLMISHTFDFDLYRYFGYFCGGGLVTLGFLMLTDICDRFE